MINLALKKIRIFHELKQKDLADKLGISRSNISEIESGKKIPSLQLLAKYSDYFNIPISSILFFSEYLETNKYLDTNGLEIFISPVILSIINFVNNNNMEIKLIN